MDDSKNNMDDRIKELEKSVNDLKNKAYVIIAVAAIFGFSGAWGYKLINDTQDSINKLNTKTAIISGKVDTLNNNINSSEKLFDNIKKEKEQEFLSTIEGFRRIQEQEFNRNIKVRIQSGHTSYIIKDKKNLDNPLSLTGKRSLTLPVKFEKIFSTTPEIFLSVARLESTSNITNFNIEPIEISNKGFKVLIQCPDQTSVIDMMRVNWIAHIN